MYIQLRSNVTCGNLVCDFLELMADARHRPAKWWHRSAPFLSILTEVHYRFANFALFLGGNKSLLNRQQNMQDWRSVGGVM